MDGTAPTAGTGGEGVDILPRRAAQAGVVVGEARSLFSSAFIRSSAKSIALRANPFLAAIPPFHDSASKPHTLSFELRLGVELHPRQPPNIMRPIPPSWPVPVPASSAPSLGNSDPRSNTKHHLSRAAHAIGTASYAPTPYPPPARAPLSRFVFSGTTFSVPARPFMVAQFTGCSVYGQPPASYRAPAVDFASANGCSEVSHSSHSKLH